jgi:hypothetical protein
MIKTKEGWCKTPRLLEARSGHAQFALSKKGSVKIGNPLISDSKLRCLYGLELHGHATPNTGAAPVLRKKVVQYKTIMGETRREPALKHTPVALKNTVSGLL